MATEAQDTLQSRVMVSILDLLGEGKIGGLIHGGQSIFFNDTPLQNPDGTYNFKGVTWDARVGTQDQAPIATFNDVETPFVVGTNVKLDTPKTVTISNPNVDQVRAIVTLPALMSTNMENGDIYGTTVQYKFQISTDGGPFVDINAAKTWTNLTPVQTVETATETWGYGWDAYSVTYTSAVQFDVGASYEGVGTTISVSTPTDYEGNTIYGWIEVQVKKWDGAQWVNHGDPVTIDTNTGLGTLRTGLYGSYSVSGMYIEVLGATKLRFERISGSSPEANMVVQGVVKVLVQTPVITITGKTRSKYQRAHLLTLPKPGSSWNLRMIRLTADSTNSALQNETYFDSYIEIVNAKLSYPNSALVGITLDSAQFNQIPRRTYMVNGLYIQVPSNYDPDTRTYSGVWDGTFKLAVSNNPAWVLYDVMTHVRYGLGEFISAGEIDKAKLYQIGRYCDELVPDGYGGMEPRFVINTVIQSLSEAYKLISDLTSVFRGMAFWNGSTVGFTQDSPADVSMEYSQANVIDGMFNYTGSSRKDRHSVVLVGWNDPAEGYKQKVEYIEDPELIAKYGVRKVETLAFGCTSRGQAARAGRWILYTERDESNMIQFRVGLDSAMVLPGEIIRIHDQYRAGKRMGGRLLASTLTSATLDAPLALAGNATISIRMPDGTFAERQIIEGPGVHSTVTWQDALTQLPVPNAIWMAAESSLQPMLARVLGLGENPDAKGTYVITALEHNPNKYAAIEQGLTLERPRTSILSIKEAPQPSDLQVTEHIYLAGPGVAGIRLHVSWFASSSSYELAWRRVGANASNWTTVTTDGLSVELDGMQAGTHEFSLKAVNAIGGARSQPVELTYEVTGTIPPPGNVSGFTATTRKTDILLEWSAATAIGTALYEIRVGASWDSGAVIVTNYSGTSFIHDQSKAGSYTYHIRAIEPLGGGYSPSAASLVYTVNAPSPVTGFDCVQNGDRIEFRWNANPEEGIAGYEIRKGSGWSSSTLVARISATSHTIPAPAAGGPLTFWIKAIISPGIYGATPVFSTTTVATASDRNVVFTDDEQAFGWLGSKYNVSVTDGMLVLDPGKNYGEYTWGVSLPQTYRARNSITSDFDAIVADTEEWFEATYKWSDPQSGRSWTISGDLATVDLSYYISKYVGLDASYVEGFSLNAQTAGENGTVAAEAVGVTYDAGRFLKGAMISDFTRLNWTIALPSEFSVTFWAIPHSITGNQVYWVAERSGGRQLICGYDSVAGELYLDPSSGNATDVLRVPYQIDVGDRVLVGIVQTATERKLYVGTLTKPTASGTIARGPLGTYAKVRLHQ